MRWVFHVGHDLDEFLGCSGEDGGERAEFCAGLEAAPWRLLSSPLRAAASMSPRPSWRPDLGGGVGEDWVEEGGDDADGFGRGVEDGDGEPVSLRGHRLGELPRSCRR